MKAARHERRPLRLRDRTRLRAPQADPKGPIKIVESKP